MKNLPPLQDRKVLENRRNKKGEALTLLGEVLN